MSDILETLRKMLGARADYDIGYWWNAVDLAIDELDKLKRIIEDREAEIEHMSVAIENSGSMAFAYKQEQEIERLRDELSHCLHLDNHNAIVRNLQEAAVMVTAERDAENGRLRELLKEERGDDLTTAALYGFHQRDGEVAALKAEIDRLRDHIKFLNSFRPDAELARLRSLVYAYPPSEPFATDGVTWQQEAGRLRVLLRPFAALPVDALGQCQRHPDEPVFAINGVAFTATDVLRAREEPPTTPGKDG